MAKKAKQFFTASIPNKGVVVWDTTLKPMCDKLNEYDQETYSYVTLYLKMKGKELFEFETKSGIKYIIQHLTRKEL
tara:strand:- start:392 stop:619 length:228 start_codon:yes stop_codon:yes gene_type:complete